MTLFKNIRRTLLNKEQTTKYLKYALGEIVLVVIGILIALQINNWNESRKAYKQENSFYADILEDLNKDSDKLDFLNKFHLKRVEYLDTLLTFVRNPNRTMGIQKFGQYIEPLYYIEDPSSYSTTFESAKTSGAFNNFQSKELIAALTEYYADFYLLNANILSIRAIVENQLEPIMSQITEGYLDENSGKMVVTSENMSPFYKKLSAIKDYRTQSIPYEKVVLQNPRFESYLIGDMGRTYNALGRIKTRKEHLIKIKQLLLNHK